MFADRIGEERVAAILQLIADKPNRRLAAIGEDLAGEFDYWFDGGACKQHTGTEHFQFADGTKAVVAMPAPWLFVQIQFPNGKLVSIAQDRNFREAAIRGDGTNSRQQAPSQAAEPIEYVERMEARPKIWHCIYCGWRCDEPHNDYICQQCRQVRVFCGGSATMVRCQSCEHWSLGIATFCEWCGARLGE